MTLRHELANNASTTLNGAIDEAVTTLILQSVASMPISGQSVVRIDNELILVPWNGTTTVTGCTRGYGGTTATSHVNGAGVSLQMAKEVFDNLFGLYQDGVLQNTGRDLDVTGAAEPRVSQSGIRQVVTMLLWEPLTVTGLMSLINPDVVVSSDAVTTDIVYADDIVMVGLPT